MFIRFSTRLVIAFVLTLGVIACGTTAEESGTTASAQPGAENTPDATAEKSNQSGNAVKELTTPPPASGSGQPGNVARPAQPGAPAVPNQTSAAATRSEIVKIPAGTMLTVVMIDAVGTDTSKAGDTFTASIGDAVVVNGKTVLAKGTKVRGRVETVDEPGRVKGKAGISLVLTHLLAGDKASSIVTQPFTAQAESDSKSDALKVGGGAAIGALVGAIAGGKKGAAVGAAVGGGAGTTAVLATRGSHLRIDSETRLNFVLENETEIDISKSTS